MRIVREEIFGPVLCCMKWQNIDEVSIVWLLIAFFLVGETFITNMQ